MTDEDMTKVNSDYLEALIDIKKDHRKIQQQLKDANEVIEFYAEGNSHYNSKYEWGNWHTPETGHSTERSGHKAVVYQEKYNENNN